MKKSQLTIQNGLSQEYRRYKREIDKAIQRVLNGGRYVLGEELERFEERFAELVGTKYAVGVGNGFDALYISCRLLRDYDSHAEKPFVYIHHPLHTSPKNAAELAGGMVTDCYEGADMYIMTVAPSVAEYIPPVGGALIEDACQSIGMKRKVPPWVNSSCYSFHPLKLLHCYGDGGAIAVNDERLYKNIKEFRNHGRIGKSRIYGVGVNSRLDEIQAAVLNVMMDKLKGRI